MSCSLQLSWFPFFLFDTDWMGREVYHGDPTKDSLRVELYGQGVREGAFGLLLNSVRIDIITCFRFKTDFKLVCALQLLTPY